jgi:hypothetical protein
MLGAAPPVAAWWLCDGGAAEVAREAMVRGGCQGTAKVVTVRDWLYRWLGSLPGSVRPSTVDGAVPVPGDRPRYDGNGNQ